MNCELCLKKKRWMIWLRRFFWKAKNQSSLSCCINACIELIESSSFLRNWVFRLYTSRDLIKRLSSKLIMRLFEFVESDSACKKRSENKILKNAICTINCLNISFLIFDVMIILRNTEWIWMRLKTWLCSKFLISKIQESAFSSFSLTIIENEHLMCLLFSWRRFWFVHSWDLRSRSRSHIVQVLQVIPSFDFFVRFNKIA
jgi:hypothetical protein